MKLTASFLGTVAIFKQCLEPAVAGTTEIAGNSALPSLITPLLLVTCALVATWLLIRRWRGGIGSSAGPLQLVHVIALGPRERLALVKVGAKYLVVGITPTTISRIAELHDIRDGTPNEIDQIQPERNDR